MSVTRGMGASVFLNLRSQFVQESGVELLRDGFMQEVGVTAWPQWNASTRTKEPCVPPPGITDTQCLRITFNGTANPSAFQGPATVGRTFRVRGWMRGDGAAVYPAYTAMVAIQNGTTSNTWQYVDVTVVAANANIVLYALGGAGYAEFIGWTVQEVLMVTLDQGDYCAAETYILSNRGGAQECASLTKLETVDRHTGVVTTVADFTASPGAPAVITPPAGWTYTCPTAGRTTQTGASTLVTGLAANAAPWRDAGGGKGLAVESQRTNRPFNSGAWDNGSAGWSASTMTNVGTAVGPDGGAATSRHFTGNASGQTSCINSVTTLAGDTVSFWCKVNTLVTATLQLWQSAHVILNPIQNVPTWQRDEAHVAVGDNNVFIIQVGAGSCDIDAAMLQVEAGLYPSSYLPTLGVPSLTRSAATLTVPLDVCNTLSGKIPRFTWVPHFAYNESLLDCTIADDSRGHLFYEQSTQKFVYEVRGRGRIASLACTFSREQSIVVRGDLDEASGLATLVLSGATSGNGTFSTYFSPRKAVVCGDGFTAATFPTQLGPSTSVRHGNSFDGGDWLAAGHQGDWVDNFTLVALIKTATVSAQDLFRRLIGASYQYDFYITAAGMLAFYADYLGTYSIVTTTKVADGVPHVIAASIAAGLVSLYVDGRLVSGPTAVVLHSGVGNVDFGRSERGSTYHFSAWPFGMPGQQVRVLTNRLMAELST